MVRTGTRAAFLTLALLVGSLCAWPAAADPEPSLVSVVPGSIGVEPSEVVEELQPEPLAEQPKSDPSPADAPARSASGAGSRTNWKRDGINPCNTADPGFGIYQRWNRKVSMGQMLLPGRGGLTKDGGFDLIVHFHGHEAIRKEFIPVAKGVVMVGIDLGIGSGAYSSGFAAQQTFERLIASVEAEVARQNGRPKAHVRKLALSSWSAGYGAISQILRQPAGKKVDAVILLDSLHTGYAGGGPTLETAQLEPFVEFAREAARGKKLMYQSFSSIQPPGYASTREVAHHLVGAIGGRISKKQRKDRYGLELFERFDRSGYHVRGYRGEDKPDHCAHIGLMRDVLRIHLGNRWHTPAGKKAPEKTAAKAVVAARPSGRVHRVVAGESLLGIAKQHGVDGRELRELNGLERGATLHVGQELSLPKPKAPPPAQKARPKGAKTHVVAEGQSLARIARRYQITPAELAAANSIPENKSIQPGQELVIPEKKTTQPRKR